MPTTDKDTGESILMAIPIADGRLCMHFGHCQQFALVEVDPEAKKVGIVRQLEPPAHQPGVYPRWLHDQGVDLVIAGGMGRRAQDIFRAQGIEVLVGAPAEPPEEVAQRYVDGKLQPGENLCDH